MPKSHTFPTLYDEALQIHISKLKAWGYLDSDHKKSGTIKWSRNGNPTGSISILVDPKSESPYIELDYKFGDEPRNYKISFVSVPSNLGKGRVWYFLCPNTYKRCRKLYSIGGYFLHREAFNGCMYESQTKSKKWRKIEKIYGYYFDSDKIYSQLYKKNFKKTYAGKPTKKYLKLMEQIRKADSINPREIERLMIYGA